MRGQLVQTRRGLSAQRERQVAVFRDLGRSLERESALGGGEVAGY